MTDYTKQAQDFIEKHGLEFRAVLIGSDCPAFCGDADKQHEMNKVDTFPRKSHIHGKHYRCTFSRKDKGHFAVDFWNSYADEEHNWLLSNRYPRWDLQYMNAEMSRKVKAVLNDKKKRVPVAYDVLACITKNDPGTFDNFCGDFGYDTDSRKAETVYQALQKEWRNVQRFFTAEELTELQEIS
jgi:hypothetical protein